MDERSMFSVLYLLMFCSRATVTQQQISFKSLENDAVLHPGSVTPVGRASDVFMDVQCITNNAAPRQWFLSPEHSTLPSPLHPTVTSFNSESGVLRVFSNFIRDHARSGVLTFQCSTNNSTLSISFELYPTLFFDGVLPAIISSSEDLLPLCNNLLPTLPSSSVTVHSGSSERANYSYCLVDSDRGSFRSRSVLLGADIFSLFRFETSFPPEVVQWVSDSEEARLPCEISGVGRRLPTVFFLKNGNRISSMMDGVYIVEESITFRRRVLVVENRRGNEGVYQCVGQAGDDESTAVTTSTYINIQFLDLPTITISSDTSSWRPNTTIILGQSDTPSEVILNCSVSAHPIPTLSWTRRQGEALHEVVGQQGVTGFRQTAFSELRVSVSELKDQVEFTCIAVLADRRENASLLLTAYSPVVFTKQPKVSDSTTSSVITLTCAASSVPIPEVTWFRIQNGVSIEQSNTSLTLIHTMEDECTATSTLQLAPITDISVTGYYCRGSNTIFQTESDTIQTLESAPTRPSVSANATEQSVAIKWTPSLGLLAVSHYSILVYQESGDGAMTLIDALNITAGGDTSTVIEGLRPLSRYAAMVVAVDVAGNRTSSELVSFRTLETAPDAAPVNVLAEAYDTRRIRLSWGPPPVHLQNGVIRKYSVLYHPIMQPERLFIFDVFSGIEVLLLMPLGPGVSYNISVAAVTIEKGPFSEAVIQRTYPLPPEFAPRPPTTISGFDATEHTIPVQLPPTNNITQFSHFWVVIVQLEDREILQLVSQNITTYSSDLPANTPYIVAELSADTYLQSRRFFVLGDENGTQPLNDFPNLYRNGPLLPGSLYTVFVRGFVHSVPPQSSSDTLGMERQDAETGRQYLVYSTSEFLPATSTLTSESSGSGTLNALLSVMIGIGVLITVLLCVMILVVTVKVRMMGKKTADSDLKPENTATSPHPPSSDNTLPRGLSMTGDEVKPEEHVYEDPLYLKTCEAYAGTDPTYKLPRPASDPKNVSISDRDYAEIEPAPESRTPEPGTGFFRSESTQSLGTDLDTGLRRSYEHMEPCPHALSGRGVPPYVDKARESQVPVGSPAAYLEPIEVAEALAAYSQPTLRVEPATSLVDFEGSHTYTTTSPAQFQSSNGTTDGVSPALEDYIPMETLAHQKH